MTTLDALGAVLQERSAANRQALAEVAYLQTREADLTRQIADLSEQEETLEKAVVLLNVMADERQAETQAAIEELVTEGLQAVFDDTLSFHIRTSQRGKSTVADLVVRSNLPTGVVETPVMDARGGGLAAVVGFLLRVVVILLTEDKPSLMVLDETFAHVSEEYLEDLGLFLRKIVERTDLQILLVTHQPTLAEIADKTYRFSLSSGRTRVTEV